MRHRVSLVCVRTEIKDRLLVLFQLDLAKIVGFPVYAAPKGDSMANSVQLQALTRGERRVLQAKVKDRRLAVRLHRRYRLIAEATDRVGCDVNGYCGELQRQAAGRSA